MEDLKRLIDGITVNTQSSIRLEADGRVSYFDPLEIPGEPHDADCVFVTHSHGDHFSPADIRKIAKEGTVLVLPASMADRAGETGVGEITWVVPGKEYEAAGICFETVPAYNPAKRFHPKANGWVGYVVKAGERKVYVAGDTDATEEAAAVKCDVALVPVGGTYTTTAAEAAALVNRMKPAAAIPTHYGSIVGSGGDGKIFADSVEKGIAVVLKLS